MTAPYYDPSIFLLEHDLDKELIQQTLEIFEFLRGDHELSLDIDKDIKQMFSDAVNKYRNPDEISIEAIRDLIAEQGYSYLSDVFSVDEEHLRMLASYLPLIQILKGTRSGLELIFNVLGVGFEITEWWEDPQRLELLSYILFVELINQPVTTNIVPKIKEFSRQYVYPFLAQITYAITYKLGKVPRVGGTVYAKNTLEVWEDFLWLYWAGDGSEENLWSDQAPYQNPEERYSLWQGNRTAELLWTHRSSSEDELTDSNMWSDSNGERSWKYANDELQENQELLEWWIAKLNDKGSPKESWCDEDPLVEEPIKTYWCPRAEEDGGLVKFSIIASPLNAIIKINGEVQASTSVKKGSKIYYEVYTEDNKYYGVSSEIEITRDTNMTVNLQKRTTEWELTVKSIPENATVKLSRDLNHGWDIEGAGQATLMVETQKNCYYEVSATGYDPKEGFYKVRKDETIVVELTPIPMYKFTLNVYGASDYTILLNGEQQSGNSITVYRDETVSWEVHADGYYSQYGEVVITKDTVGRCDLVELRDCTLTIVTDPSDATVTMNNKTTKSLTVKDGQIIEWKAVAPNYFASGGREVMTADKTINLKMTGKADMHCYYAINSANGKRLYYYIPVGATTGSNIYQYSKTEHPGLATEAEMISPTAYYMMPTYTNKNGGTQYLKLLDSPYKDQSINVNFEGNDSNIYGFTPVRFPAGDCKAPCILQIVPSQPSTITFTRQSGAVYDTMTDRIVVEPASTIKYDVEPTNTAGFWPADGTETLNSDKIIDVNLRSKDPVLMMKWTDTIVVRQGSWGCFYYNTPVISKDGQTWNNTDAMFIASGKGQATVKMSLTGNTGRWLATQSDIIAYIGKTASTAKANARTLGLRSPNSQSFTFDMAADDKIFAVKNQCDSYYYEWIFPDGYPTTWTVTIEVYFKYE